MAPPSKPSTPKPSTPKSSNTLFNYFRSTAKTPSTPDPVAGGSSGRGDNVSPAPMAVAGNNRESTERYEGETPKKSRGDKKIPKRRRIQRIESDSDEEENHSPKLGKQSSPGSGDDDWDPSQGEVEEDDEDEESGESSESDSEEGSSESQSPCSSKSIGKNTRGRKSDGGIGLKRKSTDSPRENTLRKKLKTFSGTPSTQVVNKMKARTPNNKNTATSRSDTPIVSSSFSGGRLLSDATMTQWPHLKWEWLKPEKRRDACKRLPSDENYDPTTLDVPSSFLESQTPIQRQWWEIKRKHMDTVLFFKMGKFYEFFHMDAVMTVDELNISYMKGELAHSGFPEKVFAKFANNLIQKGYKIARVEQTETPEMKVQRLKALKSAGQRGRNAPKYDDVVNREVCQISTLGVRIASAQDDSRSSPFNPESTYLYSVYEKLSAGGIPSFGVTFIDTTIGQFHIGQFEDDRHYSRLRTLFSHHPPAQVLLQKGNITQQADQLINTYAQVRKDVCNWQFPSHETVLAKLREGNYFNNESGGYIDWPEVLKTITDSGQLTAADGWELAIQAFGATVHYLKQCLVDHDLLSLKRISIYHPVDTRRILGPHNDQLPSQMVLDGTTLQNLDITESSTPDFSLLSKVNKCYTHFGKRLLRDWMCMPLAIPCEIDDRLDAIQEILSFDDFSARVAQLLRTLPDLERLLNKVHILGSAHRRKNHPEGRAIMFEEVTYSRNKIIDLLSIIKGFKTCSQIVDILEGQNPKTGFLQDIVNKFPDLSRLLKKFDSAFDHAAAQKDGKIIPKDGVDSEYDDVQSNLERITMESEIYLKQLGIQLGARVTYFGSAKNRFQLEMPDKTKVPREFEMSSSRKGFKRYVNSITKGYLDETQRVETKREDVLRDITRRIFEKFDKSHETWKIAVDCIGKLDAIMSLKTFSASQGGMCRPKVVSSCKPFIKIRSGRHPCMSIDAYITNSCYLGVSRPNNCSFGSFILLTGPNMGGKSTLMRQVALIAVLAHMGCYVPAISCEMSIIDRIFTRLGASDNLGDGESTFFVELSEASSVLRHCTKNSLVLMDELGRGTATYDGTAIAHAVATKLAKEGVRTLFSTHYHTLVESIQHLPMIQLGHMACMVENENEEDPTQETVTFLYKIAPGPCPKSYGFNAAKLAGMSDEVIRCGHQKAKEFETSTSNVDGFRKIAGLSQKLSLKTAMQLLKI